MGEDAFSYPNVTPEEAAQLVPVVQRAQDLISTEQHWTKNTYARDEKGIEVSPFSPQASAFGVMGAVARAAQEVATGNILRHHELRDKLYDVMKAILRRTHQANSLIVFNDTRTYDEVLQLLVNVSDWLSYVARGELLYLNVSAKNTTKTQ